VFLVWVNLHAGYALGFMVMAAFLIGETFNHAWRMIGGAGQESEGAGQDTPLLTWREIGMLVGVALLSVLILLINPYGVRMWVYYLDTVGIGALQDFIQEWQSPDFHPLHTHPFIWLLLGCLSLMGLSGRQADGTDLAMVGMFAYASLLAGRNFGPFALVIAPVMSRHTSAILARWSKQSRWQLFSRRRARPLLGVVNVLLLLLVVGLAIVKAWTPLTAEFNEQEQRKSLPVEASAWVLENRPDGELFNSYNWGGYLIWSLYPHYGVFADGRTDLYGDQFLREYLHAQLGEPGFEETLSKYDINLVMTYPDDALSRQLECAGSWRNAYQDEVAVVWVREPAR
jgi:hypothetical protein